MGDFIYVISIRNHSELVCVKQQDTAGSRSGLTGTGGHKKVKMLLFSFENQLEKRKCFKRRQVRPMNAQSPLDLGGSARANLPHEHLFDCLRAVSGNRVLHNQELPCNNYGVKRQLATQEGICLLATLSCSAEVRGQRLFRKSPFLKRH